MLLQSPPFQFPHSTFSLKSQFNSPKQMEVQTCPEILHDFSPRLRVYKDGQIERLLKTDTVPPSLDPTTGVNSKDVIISSYLSARLYLAPDINPNGKLPLLIYIHGGAFCLYSASSSIYQTYLNSLVSDARCVALSVDYRLAPEHPMPICYDDSLVATQWALKHSTGSGPDSWLNDFVDFDKVFLAGDSAGANIAHDIVVRTESTTRFAGIALVHPFFGDNEENPLWDYLYPGTTGVTDPRLNPTADPCRMRKGLSVCERVLVCVGGKDFLRENGVKYYDVLREGHENGEWKGELEFMESKGRGHVFHLYKPNCDEALQLLKRVADFISSSSKP